MPRYFGSGTNEPLRLSKLPGDWLLTTQIRFKFAFFVRHRLPDMGVVRSEPRHIAVYSSWQFVGVSSSRRNGNSPTAFCHSRSRGRYRTPSVSPGPDLPFVVKGCF